MTYKVGDRVKIVAPPEAKSLAREGWQGIIIGVGSSAGIYNVQFADKTTDWYFETWLEKIEDIDVLMSPKKIMYLDEVHLYMNNGDVHVIDDIGCYRLNRNKNNENLVDFSLTNGKFHTEKGTNVPSQPTVPPMPKKETNWSKIKEMTEIALTHNKDIVITINADGSKEIEITTPTTSIVESNMRTRYVPEGTEKEE